MDKVTDKEEIRKIIIEELHTMSNEGSIRAIHHSQLTPKLIKQRHIEDVVIKFGLDAELPDDDSTGVRAFFAVDADKLYLYSDGGWISEVLS